MVRFTQVSIERVNYVNRIIGFLAVACTIAQAVVYYYVPDNIFSPLVIISALLGVGCYCILSLFKKTANLAAIFLMGFDFLCICAFASADGIIDYLSTAFFSGFSFEALFALEKPVWISVLLFVISFILSSIAMYIPAYLKSKDQKRKEALVSKLVRENK